MTLPADYAERVYAGVLGKIIGVYLGRPFENWTYDQIEERLGGVTYYVNDRLDVPLRNHLLVVTDDDISGTFTFIRALADHGNSRWITAEQIGQSWLNYIIENRSILWWGGMGNSTEHTAYLRLRNGIPAPASGSMALNGRVVAEQIGGQIFIDGWGLVAPGDPELAADLARRAASVSHDGAGIHGAQVCAALIAAAFVERDLERLLDTAVRCIPADSVIAALIADIREWHAREPGDWRLARRRLVERYGYDRYGGNVHMVPNHGLVILSILFGDGDFSRAQAIVNTCGWDTDCNAGNVGGILGVRNGLAGFDGPLDWRGPVADRLYVPTADGGRAISDAVLEADAIVAMGHALAGAPYRPPKGGARFHFSHPGSVQGFSGGPGMVVENVGAARPGAGRALALRYTLEAAGVATAMTPVFTPPDALEMPGYALMASPTLYPGQVVRAAVAAAPEDRAPVECCIRIEIYGADDAIESLDGPCGSLVPGASAELAWRIPDLGGAAIARVGVAIRAPGAAAGTLLLDRLAWDGTPAVIFRRPAAPGRLWKRQWVNAADHLPDEPPEAYRVMANRGRGLLITGTREWTDYRVKATLTPHMASAVGLAARVQGLERYYAVLLRQDGRAQLVKRLNRDIVLAEAHLEWELGRAYRVELVVEDGAIRVAVDDSLRLEAADPDRSFTGGGIALICEEGRLGVDAVAVDVIGD
ncbi:MAG: ADP-ribosylglycohydrolase family protein [Chloroflexota bacterium]